MKSLSIILLLFLISCSTNNSNKTASQAFETKEELIEKGENMVTDLKSMLETRGVSTGVIPSVSVRIEPYIIFYNPEKNEVVAPWYDDLPDEIKTVMHDFASAAEMEKREFFKTFFNKFFYYHEFAHWAQYQMDNQFSPDRYVSEMEANEITVAYLQNSEEGQEFLDVIEPKVDALVAFLENPAPDGVSEQDYFNENYSDLGLNAYHYGYFQFKFVQNALNQRESVSLDEIVARRDE